MFNSSDFHCENIANTAGNMQHVRKSSCRVSTAFQAGAAEPKLNRDLNGADCNGIHELGTIHCGCFGLEWRVLDEPTTVFGGAANGN